MTTNQEARHQDLRDSTSTAGSTSSDWHALWDGASVADGTFNERMLAWINDQLGTSYTNLPGAMHAYAADGGYANWHSIGGLTLNPAATLVNTWSSDGDGFGAIFEGARPAIYVKDSGTPANNTNVTTASLTDFSTFFTYTSPSVKITRQADGDWKYQAHNLYINSATPANQAITVVSGAAYTVVITGSVSVTASGAATGTWTAGTNTFTAATTTLTLGSTSGSGTVHVRLTNAVDTYVETGAAARYAPPVHYNTDGAAYGMLVEPASTNLITNEENRTGAPSWFASNTQTQNQTGVTGIANTAWLFTSTATNQTLSHGTIAITANTFYIASLVIKRASGDNFIVIENRYPTSGAGLIQCWFNLATGTKGSSSVTAGTTTAVLDSYDMEDLGDGFYRVWVKAKSTTGTQTTSRIYAATADGSLTAAGGTYINEMWQQEVATNLTEPTSPIRTYGSTRTRTADNISKPLSALPTDAAAGTLYVKYQRDSTSAVTLATLHDATADEIVRIDADTATSADFDLIDGGVSQATGSKTTSAAAVSKAVIAYAANNVAFTADGAAVTTDGTATLPTVTTLNVGSSRTGGSNINGYVKEIMLLPERISDANAASLTT